MRLRCYICPPSLTLGPKEKKYEVKPKVMLSMSEVARILQNSSTTRDQVKLDLRAGGMILSTSKREHPSEQTCVTQSSNVLLNIADKPACEMEFVAGPLIWPCSHAFTNFILDVAGLNFQNQSTNVH